jgi:hypothetical protein
LLEVQDLLILVESDGTGSEKRRERGREEK